MSFCTEVANIFHHKKVVIQTTSGAFVTGVVDATQSSETALKVIPGALPPLYLNANQVVWIREELS